MIRRAIKDDVSNASNLVSARSGLYPKKLCEKKVRKGGPPVEVESFANDQERFISGKKGLSGPRDILIRRIPAGGSSR